MSIQQDIIFRMLPSQFRKSDESSLIYQLCQALGSPLGGLDRLGRRVLKSRYLDSVGEIADAARLALPFGEQPWPRDTIDQYRERLQSYIPLFLQGALSAERIIRLTALAFGGTADTIALPNPYKLPDRPANEANVTTGRITAVVRDESGKPSVVGFTAAVIEGPMQAKRKYTIAPTAEQSTWAIDSGTGGPFAPVIDITAGANPLVAPILAQRDTGSMLLINRIIAPGGTVRIDTAKYTVRDFGGPPSSDGPVLMPDSTAPSLLCGTGAVLDDERNNKLGEPNDAPLRLVNWSAEAIESAPLLTEGTSNWRLLQIARNDAESLDSEAHTAAAKIQAADLTTSFPDSAGCPKSVTFRWDIAPIPASFTVAYRADRQSSWYPEAPTAPNASWLLNQINRLKPAGIAYLDPASVLL